jgi:signal transduction histidine kinase
MLLAIVPVAALAYWDEERQSAVALSDFAQEQATLARSLAADLSTRLEAAQHDAFAVAQSRLVGQPTSTSIIGRYLSAVVRSSGAVPLPPPASSDRAVQLSFPIPDGGIVDLTVSMASLFTDLKAIERPNSVMLLLRPPGTRGFYTTDGRFLSSNAVLAGLDDGSAYVRLSRQESGRIGLSPRTALAGLARIDAGVSGQWGIVAVASAERERDRERWARWRLILSVATASGLVLTFGGLAMRNQRKELLLQHQLALADLIRQRDERLERAGRAATMGTLAVGVAHEISTPLGIIAGRAEQLMSRVANDERSSSGVRVIIEQIDRIHRVIRGLLGLARGDAPTAEAIESNALVREAVSLVEHRFEQAGVHLRTQVSSQLPPLHGDPRLLEHAVVNLLLNACDACPRGGAVAVTARADDAGRELTIAVVDDGPGISQADAGRVLEPFFSTKASGKGTGIGLAIVQEIVTSHRGSLSLESVKPHGTRAVIRLPSSTDSQEADLAH